MTINSIDPLTPDANAVAGLGDDEIRALKLAITSQFVGEVGDLYDIPITAGPRALNAVADKADQADLDAVIADLDTVETQQGLNVAAIVDHEARIAAIEGDYTTASEAAQTAWPVGSLFVSADGGAPNAKGIPGTWVVVGDGRVLLGDPTTGVEAGSMSVTLAEGDLPAHKHQHSSYRENSGVTALPSVYSSDPAQTFSSHLAGRDASSAEFAIFNTDEGIGLDADPVDITPAHLTVRFYRRTA